MSMIFAETLKKLRTESGLSQRELAERVFVTRTAVTRWENGSRLPDAAMISRLAVCLGADVNLLLHAVTESDGVPNVIVVDDRKIALSGALAVLEEVLPNANITGFVSPSEAVAYAKENRISLAFLDIEMGKVNGLDRCGALLAVNPLTNIIFLTAYASYAVGAWRTGACGYLLKPVTADDVRGQLKHLRYPLLLRGENE